MVVRRWVLKPILDFLRRDDPDELGEGDLGEATFGEGSGCEPLATGGDPLPQPGWLMEKPSRRRRWDVKPLKVNEHNPPSPERRLYWN